MRTEQTSLCPPPSIIETRLPSDSAAPLLKVQFENDDRTREQISLVSLTTLFDGWRMDGEWWIVLFLRGKLDYFVFPAKWFERMEMDIFDQVRRCEKSFFFWSQFYIREFYFLKHFRRGICWNNVCWNFFIPWRIKNSWQKDHLLNKFDNPWRREKKDKYFGGWFTNRSSRVSITKHRRGKKDFTASCLFLPSSLFFLSIFFYPRLFSPPPSPSEVPAAW